MTAKQFIDINVRDGWSLKDAKELLKHKPKSISLKDPTEEEIHEKNRAFREEFGKLKLAPAKNVKI
jgi:hypothetical protein